MRKQEFEPKLWGSRGLTTMLHCLDLGLIYSTINNIHETDLQTDFPDLKKSFVLYFKNWGLSSFVVSLGTADLKQSKNSTSRNPQAALSTDVLHFISLAILYNEFV